MNIMLVSVTERTREIGIRMAIGARGRHVLLQFLFEAVTLSVLGGLIGVLFGVGVAKGFARFAKWPMVISPTAIVVAFAVSVTIGIFFGFYPARKASRLDPIDATRPEPVAHAVDELFRRRGARRDADGADAVEPGRVDLGLVVDQVGRDAAGAGHVDQPVGVGGVPGPDHEQQVDLLQRLPAFVVVHRGRAVAFGERKRPLIRSIGHYRDAHSFVHEALQRQLSDVARAQNHRSPSGHATKNLLGELYRGRAD
jgi:hypothetical protein